MTKIQTYNQYTCMYDLNQGSTNFPWIYELPQNSVAQDLKTPELNCILLLGFKSTVPKYGTVEIKFIWVT